MSYTVTAKSGETFTFPDGFPPERAKAAMDEHFAKQKATLIRTPSPLLGMLPSAGGMVGGLMGGVAGGIPGAIAGAALGGAIGESGRRFGRGMPQELGAGALEQAAYEATGQGLGRGIARLGRPMIRKVVSFQRAATPSVILDEFGKPFMIEGAQVAFKKRAPKEARYAADVAMDVASHAMPGGALLRPVMRGIRGKVSSGASGLGSWVNGRSFQMFARQFPRAAAALKQMAVYEDQPDATSVNGR